jgi:hypothetical protein
MFDKFYYKGNLENAKAQAISSAKTEYVWLLSDLVDYEKFNLRYVPSKFELDQVHVWSSHNNANSHTTWLMPTNQKDYKINFHNDLVLDNLPVQKAYWNIADDIESVIDQYPNQWVWLIDSKVNYDNFNFLWLPDSWDNHLIHVFTNNQSGTYGTTWLINTGLVDAASLQFKYHKSNLSIDIQQYFWNIADDIESVIDKYPNQWVWLLDSNIDYDNFNLNFLPEMGEEKFIHCFTNNQSGTYGTTWLINTGLVNKDLQFKYYKSNLSIDIQQYFWPKSFDCLIGKDYNDKLANWVLQNVKVDGWFWLLDANVNYDDFNLNFLPEIGEEKFIHCFTSGESKFSSTWLVNSKYLKDKQFKFKHSSLKIPVDKIAVKSVDFDTVDKLDINRWSWIYNSEIDHSDFNFDWLQGYLDQEYVHCFSLKNNNQLSYTWLVNPISAANKKLKMHTSNLYYNTVQLHWPDFSKTELKGYDWNDKLANWIIQENFASEWIWLCDERTDYAGFDFTWLPDLWGKEYIHCFTIENNKQLSNTWLVNTKTVKNKKYKFHKSSLTVAVDKIYWPDYSEINSGTDLNYDMNSWLYTNQQITGWTWVLDSRLDYSDFDFSWLPDDWDQDHIHCFTLANNDSLSYTWLVNPNSIQQSKYKYHASNLKLDVKRINWPKFDDIASGLNWQESLIAWLEQQNLENDWYWICDSRIDYSDFDFTWLPNNWEQSYIHCFTLANTKQLSYTWLINPIALKNKKYKLHESSLTLGKEYFDKIYWPNFNDIFLSGLSWEDSLINWLLDQNLPDKWVWICDTRINYNTFNFDWLPDNWDQDYIHAFALEGNEKLSYTWLVNPLALKNKSIKYHNSNLKLQSYDIIELDMINLGKSNYKLQRFLGDMQAALTTAARKSSKEWLWVISNCDNYKNFNFNWLPDLSDIEYTHCWSTEDQLKGETFLIHIPSYIKTQQFIFKFKNDSIKRIQWPTVYYNEDNLVEAIKQNKSQSLYTLYVKQGTAAYSTPEPCLWENRPVISLNDSNSASLVPRDCIVKEEIYEYPYLEKSTEAQASDVDLTVIFLHNDEIDYFANSQRLNETLPKNLTSQRTISHITPRLKAYKAAAEASHSDWFLAVFAKCYMKDSFKDFTWRPDYWQKPKHYIFHNHNYDLDLTYGHMAPIAYNKKLMLENTGGLDMTLAQSHAVVPIVLSETRLTDPWDTWRTAFRETVKLLYYAQTDNSIELQYRLDRWLNAHVCWAKHNPWYQYGSQDAKNFFESVDGEWHWIMMTNEWDWLRKKFNNLYITDFNKEII